MSIAGYIAGWFSTEVWLLVAGLTVLSALYACFVVVVVRWFIKTLGTHMYPLVPLLPIPLMIVYIGACLNVWLILDAIQAPW